MIVSMFVSFGVQKCKIYKVLVKGRKFGSVVLLYTHYILILFVRVSYLLFSIQ